MTVAHFVNIASAWAECYTQAQSCNINIGSELNFIQKPKAIFYFVLPWFGFYSDIISIASSKWRDTRVAAGDAHGSCDDFNMVTASFLSRHSMKMTHIHEGLPIIVLFILLQATLSAGKLNKTIITAYTLI